VTPICAGLLFASAASVWASSDPPVDDPFLASHRAAVARNQTTIQFEIRFKAGRSVFRPGERIAIELVFTPGRVKYLDGELLNGWQFADVVLDREEGVARPFEILMGGLDWFGVPGGMPGCGLGGSISGAPPPPPVVVPVTLDARFRFDTPGHYRVYVRSRHHNPTDYRAAPLTSNILDLEIAPRDEASDARVLAHAVAVIEDPHSRTGDFRAAVSNLRGLATTDAGLVLTRLFERADLAFSMDVRKGLFAVPDRAAIVAALRRELRRPERNVTGRFVRDLALLEMARRRPEGPPYSHDEYLQLVERYSLERATALSGQPALLSRAIHEELSDSYGGQIRGPLSAALQHYPRQTIAAFRRLSPQMQTARLRESWRRFDHPVFLPLVRAAYRDSIDGDADLYDIALRRLTELAPSEGHAAIRAELRRIRPHATIETLSMLPDRVLPGLDAAWIAMIRAARDDDTVAVSAARRLSRYGVATSQRAARTLLTQGVNTLHCQAVSFLVAYISRTAPRHTDWAIRQVRNGTSSGQVCAPNLFTSLGEEYWSPEIERATGDALFTAVDPVAADAAQALGRHGSSASRAVLEARLAALGGSTSPVTAPFEPSSLEARLLGALTTSPAWTLPQGEYNRRKAACTARRCGAAFDIFDRTVDPQLSVHFFKDHETGRISASALGARLASTAEINRKLRQLPPGTRVYCGTSELGEDSERWLLRERAALCEAIRVDAAAHGVVVTQERKLAGTAQ
jgi:hypothetical protein